MTSSNHYYESMERGIISFTNVELSVLHDMAVAQGCLKTDLLAKLSPVTSTTNPNQEHTVQISEDEAEILLDCMPVPSKETDFHLSSARIKIQQFITQS